MVGFMGDKGENHGRYDKDGKLIIVPYVDPTPNAVPIPENEDLEALNQPIAEGTAALPPVPPPKPAITLFPEQQQAKELFLEWFNSDPETRTPIFRIFGYAGTGKTTLTKSTVADIDNADSVLYGAFSGKAALVMQRNGLPARTIHSTIYKPVPPSKEECVKVEKELEGVKDSLKRKELQELLKQISKLHFELNKESSLSEAPLFVLDECSMVNDEMLNDILSFKVPLLVLGDPGQLPPIEGTGALIRDKPNVMLETIHRQALDNPIINLSFKARVGLQISDGVYGESIVCHNTGNSSQILLSADQILTGKNDSRRKLNRMVRTSRGYADTYPQLGEKLICLKNNAAMGLLNGLICTVTDRGEEYDTYIEYTVKTEDGHSIKTKILRAHFIEYDSPGYLKSLKWWDFKDADEFDFGYAITVHKAQGSQWDNVVLWDDKFFVWDKPQRNRWLYTAITRAANKITIIR